MKKILVLTSLLVIMSFSLFGAAVLSEEESGILLMSEEEKLARDVYQELYDMWGLRSFANIAKSEQVHMDEVAELVGLYGLESPVLSEAGKFTDPELQKLYDNLIAQGSVSIEEAIKAAIAIEELDIKDLQGLISSSSDQNITAVYSNLLAGSYNHLESFTKQLDRFENNVTGNIVRGQSYATSNPGRSYSNTSNYAVQGTQNGYGNMSSMNNATRGTSVGNQEYCDCIYGDGVQQFQNSVNRNYYGYQATPGSYGNNFSQNVSAGKTSGRFQNFSSKGGRYTGTQGNYINTKGQNNYFSNDCQMTGNTYPGFQQNFGMGSGYRSNSTMGFGNRFSTNAQRGNFGGNYPANTGNQQYFNQFNDCTGEGLAGPFGSRW